MNTTKIEKDIEVVCVTASNFPEGIQETFRHLFGQLDKHNERTIYGISYNTNGKMVYKAAATALVGDNENLERLTIQHGNYATKEIKDYYNNIPEIGKTFQEFISTLDYDPQGVCVELYLDQQDMLCMIKLKDN